MCLLHPVFEQCPVLHFSPSAAHLKSKKHHYHVRKKRKSDLTCDESQSAAAAPAFTGETLSEDTSCAPVAPGCSENSQDTRTTHKEVPVTF